MNNSVKNTLKPLPLVTALAASLALFACGGGGGSSTPANNGNTTGGNTGGSGNGGTTTPSELQTNSAVAKNFIDNIAIPAYKSYATKSNGLSDTIQAYCDAIGKSNETTSLASAQSAWLSLKNDWQKLLAYAVGPVAANSNNLANLMYTPNNFGNATQNLIAGEVAKRKADASYTLTSSSVRPVRGIDALEYLLYTPETDTTKKTDNCNYAVVVAKDIKTTADRIVTAWADTNTGRDAYLTPSTSNAVDLIQPFFNNVANIADVNVKTTKLGIPAGLKTDSTCTTKTCPELVEHSLSKTSYASIKANLEGLKMLFNGSDGFRRYYTQKDMTSQARTFGQQIDAAIATIDAQNTSLYQQLENIKTKNKSNECATVAGTGITEDSDLAPCQLHFEVRKISDDIKTGSFKLAVNLSLPDAAAGDGD